MQNNDALSYGKYKYCFSPFYNYTIIHLYNTGIYLFTVCITYICTYFSIDQYIYIVNMFCLS